VKAAVKYYVLAAEQGGRVGAVVAASLPSRDFCCDTMIIYLELGLADAQFNAGVCLSVHADRYRNADLDGT